jgi:hypothetical protein
MSVLLIGPEEKEMIATALQEARANPTPLEALMAVADGSPTFTLKLSDRKDPQKVEDVQRLYPSQQLMLGTYRVAISYEMQPAGMFKHLSVSSARKGKVPGPEVMQMVMEEFGFSGLPPLRPHRIWVEEFEPGWEAVNVAELEPS